MPKTGVARDTAHSAVRIGLTTCTRRHERHWAASDTEGNLGSSHPGWHVIRAWCSYAEIFSTKPLRTERERDRRQQDSEGAR